LLSLVLGRGEEALAYLERCLRLSREIGYRVPETEGLENLGAALAMLGRYEEATLHYERCLAICREIQNSRMEGYSLIGLGAVAEQSGDLAAAERFYEQAEGAWTSIQASADVAEVLFRLGCLFRSLGREDEARTKLREAVIRAREFRSVRVEVLSLAHLALLPGGDAGEARERFLICEQRLPLAAKMEARFLLWKATGDRSHLEAASELLAALRRLAPGRDRGELVARVPLYREIAAAAAGA